MSRARSMDLNCDMGEGFPHDEALMDLVTSANIACGGHVGDQASMLRAVLAAAAQGVHIGAHPSLPDRKGFGRRELAVPPDELEEEIARQVIALQVVAERCGARLSHVKPHGALYSMAARDPAIGMAVVRAVARAAAAGPGGTTTLFTLAGSPLVALARDAGLTAAEEAFADRGYRDDGALAARGTPGALIADPVVVAARALRMAREGKVISLSGSLVAISPDTICIHGDEPNALECARAIREVFREAGVALSGFGAP